MKQKPNWIHLSLILLCLSTGVLFSCSSGNDPNTGTGPTVTASPSTPEVIPADGVRESMYDLNEEEVREEVSTQATIPKANPYKNRKTEKSLETKAEEAKEDVSVTGFPLSDKDREITRSLREALVDNEKLSIMAKNLQIFSEKGQVILRGPVESQKEKEIVTALAKKTRGVMQIKDEMEVSRE